MFKTPPRHSRHLTTTVRTRSAWKKEELTMKEDPARDVQSEILKKGNPETAFSVITRPKTEGDCLKSAHSLHPVSSKQHSNSTTAKSMEARKKLLEFEAAKAMAEIERQAIKKNAELEKKAAEKNAELEKKAAEKNAQLEKSLIEQKLAAEIAALESASKSRRSSLYQPTEIDSIGKVQQWLDKSHLAENMKNCATDADRDGAFDGASGGGGGGAGSSDQIQNLVSAIHQSNLQNKQLMSRFATSKDLPQFHGDPLEWLAYKLAYDESTKICKYSDAENMWRLRKSLKGEAKETVSSLLIGTTAPQTIIEALELRYGRPETIIHKITFQLKKIPPLSQNYHHEIISFSIKIKNFVAAAKAVKQTDYLRSPELVSSVLAKCPSALINKWADYYSLNCNIEKAKLEMLAEFLYNEANKISAAGLTHLQSQSDYRKKPEERKSQSVLLGAKSDEKITCKFCKVSRHKLPECARFKRALTKDRWRFVRVNNLCHKCLLATHSRDTCSAAPCPIEECGLPHHRLLHWKLKAGAKSENSEKTESDKILTNNDNSSINSDNKVEKENSDCLVSKETVTHAMNDSTSCVFLKVVPVNIHGPKGVIRTHALLDDGATVSLISADIANSVELHGQKQTLCVRGAWDSELTCESEKIKCQITNINNDSFELSARKINELNLPLQKLSNIKIKNYAYLNKVNNYISCSENVKPKLLIGQDNYHLIAPIKTIMRSKNEPCATLTPLGWCVHGVCPVKRKKSSSTSECAMITVNQPRRSLASHSSCLPRHACACAAANTFPLVGTQTGACGITADVSSDHTLTNVNTNECIYCYRQDGSIHTDSENDERLNDMVRKSFLFESIGVHHKPRQNKDDLKAVEIVEKSAKIIDGKWVVGLPWKDENAKMESSFSNAYRRFKTIERKMSLDQGFAKRYKERVQHLFINGYACKIESNESNQRASKEWYLPHFGVDNPNKKKLRLVFDAAATSAGQCLNDYLLQGPDLLESLLGIMLRFRERKIGLTGDIKDMFLRIKIKKTDQDALRFLWRDNQNDNEPIQKYKMTSLIFGANCSPFIAQFIKNLNAQRFANEMPEAMHAIINSHYMDDYIDSFDNLDIALKTMRDVTYIHQQGDFEIRNWTSNEPKVCQNVPKEILSDSVVNFKTEEDNLSERTLGLLWYPKTDAFGFNLSLQKIPEKILTCEQKPTKRELLRIVMSIFDIYGLLTPFTIKAKIIIQDTWKSTIKWDEQIPTKQFELFRDWISQLQEIKDIRIPRWYFHSKKQVSCDEICSSEKMELHLFCDASPAAYAAVAYWRVHTDNTNVCVSFIASKSRVAPIKPNSIPRLELQGAVLACRLADVIQKEHRLQPSKRYFWTDSMTVLHWIKNDTRNYKTFVANRLGEIDELSKMNEWHYIRSDKNIADVATKNMSYKLNKDCEWFQGPGFLFEKESSWMTTAPEKEKRKINKETLEMVHHVYATESANLPVPVPEKFSSWLRLLRSTATVLLFLERCKKTCKKEIDTELLQRAERLLTRYAQMQSFSTEIDLLKNNRQVQPDSRIRTLTPYLDEWGVIRVGGRVEATRNVSTDIKRPIILDGRHHIARLITKTYHEKSAHGNNEMVVNELRQRYWLLNIRPTVRSVASQCLYCRMRKVIPSVPRMADLPAARLSHHQRAFTHCGVDLFGPMEITVARRREPRYGVLFTCMTVRAVHIEVVPSLTTDSFIMALRRMASRRGWPQNMYSDNGTNLRGADAELRKSFEDLDQTRINQEMTNRGVSWSFSSPLSPHKGGAWERLIRSVKTSLKVILKERAPREETLITLLAEVENIVNSRPLTHVSVDPNHMEALTPNHFLLGSSSNLPVPGTFDDGDLYLRKMWRTAQRLADLFWQRWVKEVLPDLLPRQKWYQEEVNLKVGDLVVIVDPNLPRNTWPKGIIERVLPGSDHRIRTVEIKTKSGVLTRPVTRLALLPVNNPCP